MTLDWKNMIVNCSQLLSTLDERLERFNLIRRVLGNLERQKWRIICQMNNLWWWQRELLVVEAVVNLYQILTLMNSAAAAAALQYLISGILGQIEAHYYAPNGGVSYSVASGKWAFWALQFMRKAACKSAFGKTNMIRWPFLGCGLNMEFMYILWRRDFGTC